ncbi:MAG: GNAT family N-acetyltransferase [Oscillospiraceae bacterium]|nr:GNAT family N-acetyltransferase [Oscillospiraceae bacterium]
MEKIRFFEEIAANGHVALNVMQYDGWLMRFSEGYTGRANSVSVLYPSYRDISEKIAYCEECYEKQGLPCIFKLTDADMELSSLLSDRGYKVVTPTDVKVLSLDGNAFGYDDGCIFSGEPWEWLPSYFEFEGITDTNKQDIYKRMLAKVVPPTIYCTVMYEGVPAACASAVIERGYMLLQNVVVRPGLRGKGLGRRLCSAVIAKAYEQGADYSYLQVVQDNTAAVALYDKLGFEKIYSYWYMKK